MLKELPFTIDRLHAVYGNGTTANDVISECVRRIEQLNDPGIFIALSSAELLQQQLDQLGPFDLENKPLWGIPFVVKDNIDVAGLSTTAACPDFAYLPEQDAVVVALLKQAGALCLGKTNLDQFATGLVGVRTPYPVPKNALDPEMVPGGSSSGSAVAVAQGLACFGLGTDTAGSGRVPAALNNIVGLKPSLGALSNTGVVPACRSLDTVSIFSLTVADAYLVFRIVSRFDASDCYAREFSPVPLSPLQPNLKVAVPCASSRQFFGDLVQQASFEQSVAVLQSLGTEVIEIDFAPFYEAAALLYDGAWVAERYAAVGEFMTRQPESVYPVTKQIIEKATTQSAADAFTDIYSLKSLKRRADALISSVDLVCVPSIPTFYTLDDLKADPVLPNTRLGTYTNFANLLDMCALALPVAPRTDGRPGSVTLLAPAGEDGLLASLAYQVQQQIAQPLGATSWTVPESDITAMSDPAKELQLAVVGAHMSGLPLNGELTKLNARFLYRSHTASCYRLYSLAGGPPYRPGLIRDEQGEAIAIEVWAVPKTQFGSFIEGVPAPLGIGTLELENGNRVKGFICEAMGREGAEDITRFKGWRAYLTSKLEQKNN